ncbi:MAG: 3-oxoacid CoA-transferase subunit A [Dehalococcoidia bacterium]|nr:3-oxoacid CoA-transferase subunit A [Dehalococcoidia bacterium]MSQ35146.1 3-oxoacid CoA-transferase subunit A [Dehalococcoidia bacterium]
MPKNKLVRTFRDAVADIPDGATVMIGGFGGAGGQPTRLMLALRDHGVKNLTLIGNVAGISKLTGYGWPKGLDPIDQGIFFASGQANRIICSFPVTGSPNLVSEIEKAWREGRAEVDIVPQGTLIERIRAAGAGIAAFYTPTGAGTPVAKGREVRIFNGREHLLEYALPADFALVRAKMADAHGNLMYVGTSRAFNPAMATAAKVVIAEVDEVVPSGGLDPERIGTPGVYVDRIVVRDPGDPLP